MKKIVLKICCLFLFFGVLLPKAIYAYADTQYIGNLVDTAGLLDEDETESVENKLDDLSDKYGSDIVILLVQDYKSEYSEYESLTDMSDPFYLIEEYYYQNGYNLDNGIIIMVSMEERDWALCRFGDVKDAIDDDYGYDYITSNLQEHLSDGEYYEACDGFLDDVNNFMQAWEDGEPYSASHTLKTPAKVIGYFAAAIGVSVVLALIIVLIMKARMKTARPKPAANEYVKKDSFVLTNQQDIYLYSNTTKTAIPKNNGSSGGGSRSGSHGGSGGSGKF